MIMSDTAIVASYNPLQPVFPQSGETLVAQGSSVQIVWTGGPQPWPENPSNHFAHTMVEKADLLKVENEKEMDGVYAYKVQCLGLGETSITLSVGNLKSKSLPKPVVLTSTVKVICGTPAGIQLTPLIQGPVGLPPCPASARAGRVATQAYLDLPLQVDVKDSEGRVFDGVDSVEVSWSLSDSSLGQLEAATGLLRKKQLDLLQQPSRPYQMLKVNSKKGSLDIKASLPKPGLLSSPPESTVKLALVEDARIEPRSMEVFHHKSAHSAGKAVQGSGYFVLETSLKGVSGPEIVKSHYHHNNQSILVTPMQPGNTQLVLKDLCLSAVEPGTSSVHVKGVVKVELDILDRVEMGKQLTGEVRLYSANNKLLDSSVLDYVALSVAAQSDVVSVGKETSLTPSVKGDKLGSTQLVATASYLGIKVSSEPAPVQVFPPLRIEPRNITLIIGASVQVLTTGGPSDATIEYLLGDSSIGLVNGDGLVTGSTLGSTSLTARAVGVHKSGRRVEYSRDTVHVHVVALTDIRLHTPTKKIVVGGTLPVNILGQDDNIDGYSFASALPHLEITWSVQGSTNGESLRSSWHETGLSLSSSNSGVALFYGQAPGKAVVSVKVHVTEKLTGASSGQFQVAEHRTLTASTEITIVEDLYSKTPDTCCSNHVLIAPGSTLQLNTNRNGKSVFSKISDSSTSPSLTVDAKGLVKVSATSSTGAPTGSSTSNILATVEEEVGLKLHTSWVVEVRPVHYLVLQASGAPASWSASQGSVVLPRGGAVNLEVSCHDALGRKFVACPLDLKARPSRFDLSKLTPAGTGKLTLNLLSIGYTVHKVSDMKTELTAWAVSQVGLISVPATLTVGDVIQLNTNIQQVSQGSWSVEPAGQLVFSPSGVAIAKKTGPTRIKLTTQQGDSFYTDTTVISAPAVSFPADVVITCKEEPRVVPFTFSGGLFSASDLTGLDPSSFVKCRLSSKTLNVDGFQARAVLLASSGWGCEFTCVSSPVQIMDAVVDEIIKKKLADQLLPDQPRGYGLIKVHKGDSPSSLSVTVETSQGAVLPAAQIEYVPPFSVSSPVLEVGPGGAQLRVSGHRDVLTGLTTRGEGVNLASWWLEDSQLVLPVSLVSPIQQEPWVQVKNPSTGDVVKVAVLPVLDSTYTHKATIIRLDMRFLYTIIIGVVLGCLLFTKFIPKPASPPPAPATSSPSRSEPPAAASPAASPQPYLWSVDNSPIYGSPLVKRSPPANARNLTTYSYS